LACLERPSKRFKIGDCRGRLIADTSAGRFAFVLLLRHFHIHRARLGDSLSVPVQIFALDPVESSTAGAFAAFLCNLETLTHPP
jgi:hypothetical protein